jgi:ubiquinone/menaquinone biosynthesis C-methylase UbiE
MKNNQTAAEKTDFLAERIKQNESNQSLNLNEWAFGNIEGSNEPIKILEYCCGTGKQTEYLRKLFPNAHLTCLDISEAAIQAVKDAKFFDAEKINAFASGMDEFVANNKLKFDLVFVSYGFYYAKNMDNVILKTIELLNFGGKLIVLGPYGKNNKLLFDVVKSSGVKIDDFVTYSCTDYMHDKVIKLSLNSFEEFKINTAINPVKWKSPTDVVLYWKNTTFYDSSIESIFQEKIDNHFKINDSFIMEKHIMLFQGLKRK